MTMATIQNKVMRPEPTFRQRLWFRNLARSNDDWNICVLVLAFVVVVVVGVASGDDTVTGMEVVGVAKGFRGLDLPNALAGPRVYWAVVRTAAAGAGYLGGVVCTTSLGVDLAGVEGNADG